MSILKALANSFKDKERKGWDRMYYFFDIHATMIKPNYQVGNIPTEFYEHALETLQFISKLDDVCMILYTCSHPHEIVEYLEYFKANNVNFIHVNKNPEVKTDLNGYGCYEDKPYINVLFDDKAGFDGETDWIKVKNFLEYKYGVKEYKGFSDDDLEQLGAELDNEGTGYWVQHYTRDWIQGNYDYEFTELLINARDSMNALESYLENKDVFY